MKILIVQPKLEKGIDRLEQELRQHPEADIVIFPEGYLNSNIAEACQIARRTNTTIITGYRNPKDRAIIIDASGSTLLDRAKYSPYEFVEASGLTIGLILCVELVLQALDESFQDVNLIVHPIGVGMFSEEQFEEWVIAAKKIAVVHKTMIIGTSHADGSFRDSDVSIPIAYCIDSSGDTVFIAKNDVRTRLLNTETKQVTLFEA